MSIYSKSPFEYLNSYENKDSIEVMEESEKKENTEGVDSIKSTEVIAAATKRKRKWEPLSSYSKIEF